ncbi:hypothetical protein P4W15_09930 [Morganella morganii]|nr:hypothetical protein [Morganella morganii]
MVSATARFFGSDTDKRVLDMARANARRAGVDKLITFQQKDATKLENPLPEGPKGTIISNPPYGERLESEPALIALHSVFGRVVKTRFPAGVCHYSVLPWNSSAACSCVQSVNSRRKTVRWTVCRKTIS